MENWSFSCYTIATNNCISQNRSEDNYYALTKNQYNIQQLVQVFKQSAQNLEVKSHSQKPGDYVKNTGYCYHHYFIFISIFSYLMRCQCFSSLMEKAGADNYSAWGERTAGGGVGGKSSSRKCFK